MSSSDRGGNGNVHKLSVGDQYTNQTATSIQSLSMAAMIRPSPCFYVSKPKAMHSLDVYLYTYIYHSCLHIKYSNSWICQSVHSHIHTHAHVLFICLSTRLIFKASIYRLRILLNWSLKYQSRIRFVFQFNTIASQFMLYNLCDDQGKLIQIFDLPKQFSANVFWCDFGRFAMGDWRLAIFGNWSELKLFVCALLMHIHQIRTCLSALCVSVCQCVCVCVCVCLFLWHSTSFLLNFNASISIENTYLNRNRFGWQQPNQNTKI